MSATALRPRLRRARPSPAWVYFLVPDGGRQGGRVAEVLAPYAAELEAADGAASEVLAAIARGESPPPDAARQVVENAE